MTYKDLKSIINHITTPFERCIYGVITVSKPSTNVIVLGKDNSGRITVAFPYDPQLVERVKTIEGRKWHPEKKYWSFPDSDGTLEKILEVFEGEKIHLDPALYISAGVDPALKGTVPDLPRTTENHMCKHVDEC